MKGEGIVHTVISWAALIALFLGGADYLLDNRLGIGREFCEGIMSAGRLLLCMAGFMVLAPVLAKGLGPITAPFFRAFGADPSALAGLILANDSGGARLALALADSEVSGRFNGLIVGATMGTTVMFNIPLVMSYTDKEERPAAIYGLLAGIATVPLACLAGGYAAGFPSSVVLPNTLPVLVISIVLSVLLAVFKERIVFGFTILGKILQCVSLAGLVCGAIQLMTGLTPVAGMDTLETVFPVVGGIAMFLAGAFPLMALVRRVFSRALNLLGKFLGTNSTGVAGLLVSMANSLPALSMLHDMDDRGRMINVAFLVSASCMLGDHMAYTAQVAPELCGAVAFGKAVGGVTAVVLAAFLAPRLLKTTLPTNKNDPC